MYAPDRMCLLQKISTLAGGRGGVRAALKCTLRRVIYYFDKKERQLDNKSWPR